MKENFLMWLANRMPRSLVYWCLVRACTHATTGKYSNQELPALTLVEAAKRWKGESLPSKPEQTPYIAAGPYYYF